MIVGSQIKDNNDQQHIQAGLNSVGTCLIIFGLVTFVVAIVGSFSVIKDNRTALYIVCLNKLFRVFLQQMQKTISFNSMEQP